MSDILQNIFGKFGGLQIYNTRGTKKIFIKFSDFYVGRKGYVSQCIYFIFTENCKK